MGADSNENTCIDRVQRQHQTDGAEFGCCLTRTTREVIPKGHHQPMADPFVRHTGARHREDSAIDVFVADLAVLLEFEELLECHEGRVWNRIFRDWLRDPISLRSRAVELLEPASDSEPIAEAESDRSQQEFVRWESKRRRRPRRGAEGKRIRKVSGPAGYLSALRRP
jgi:hypothetical protein